MTSVESCSVRSESLIWPARLPVAKPATAATTITADRRDMRCPAAMGMPFESSLKWRGAFRERQICARAFVSETSRSARSVFVDQGFSRLSPTVRPMNAPSNAAGPHAPRMLLGAIGGRSPFLNREMRRHPRVKSHSRITIPGYSPVDPQRINNSTTKEHLSCAKASTPRR